MIVYDFNLVIPFLSSGVCARYNNLPLINEREVILYGCAIYNEPFCPSRFTRLIICEQLYLSGIIQLVSLFNWNRFPRIVLYKATLNAKERTRQNPLMQIT